MSLRLDQGLAPLNVAGDGLLQRRVLASHVHRAERTLQKVLCWEFQAAQDRSAQPRGARTKERTREEMKEHDSMSMSQVQRLSQCLIEETRARTVMRL